MGSLNEPSKPFAAGLRTDIEHIARTFTTKSVAATRHQKELDPNADAATERV